METSCAAVTVSVAVPVTPESAAAICALPAAVPVAVEPENVAGPCADHATWAVRSCVEPSVQVPVAAYGWVRPFAMDEVEGEIAIETSSAAVTVSDALPVMPANVAVTEAGPVAVPVAVAPEKAATPGAD